MSHEIIKPEKGIVVVFGGWSGIFTYDTERFARTFGRLLERDYGLPHDYCEKFYISAWGRTVEDQFSRIMTDDGRPPAQSEIEAFAKAWKERAYNKPRPTKYDLRAGAMECLDSLGRTGCKRAVSSNMDPYEMFMEISNHGILDKIDLWAGGPPILPDKSVHWRYFKDQLGGIEGRAVVVADSKRTAENAAEWKCKVVRINLPHTRGQFYSDAEIGDLAELPKTLPKLFP
ncbi:MAG: hypothetical protein HY368_01215 [Candidatus Aenigmarchaeota archaeon]|nr:hypothetical protein [Candidatus Aenigmarchaeota archaeon]